MSQQTATHKHCVKQPESAKSAEIVSPKAANFLRVVDGNQTLKSAKLIVTPPTS